MAYTYCSYSDIVERLNLAGVGFDTATYNSTTLSPLQQNAENIINGELEGFYNVPFTATIPLIINELCAILSAINVFDVVFGLDSYEVNKTVLKYKEIAKEIMKDIKNGKIALPSKYRINYKKYFVGTQSPYFDFDNKDWDDLE